MPERIPMPDRLTRVGAVQRRVMFGGIGTECGRQRGIGIALRCREYR
jgi:hypothetical protein